jgi:hypothetical protein
MLFGYPVASSWMSCCGIPTRKLRIILMNFLVMFVFGWVFLAALINYGLLSSICGVEVLMCVLQTLSLSYTFHSMVTLRVIFINDNKLCIFP